MSELIQKLGLDGRLLLSQAVNFLILLYLLQRFAYKPVMNILKERREKIEEGLAKAEEADSRLKDAQNQVKDKLKGAEEESLAILRSTQDKAKKLEADLLQEARKKETDLLQNAERAAKAKGEEAADKFKAEAGTLLRQALIKAVGLKPEAIDETMIQNAVDEIKRTA